jgi:hypothetical protein
MEPLTSRSAILMIYIIVNDDFFFVVLKFDNVLFLLSNQALRNKKK